MISSHNIRLDILQSMPNMGLSVHIRNRRGDIKLFVHSLFNTCPNFNPNLASALPQFTASSSRSLLPFNSNGSPSETSEKVLTIGSPNVFFPQILALPYVSMCTTCPSLNSSL